MRLRSFKLRFADTHARVVFDEAAVDLLGDEAEEAFRLAAPLLAEIAGIEPNGRVRSLAMDLERPRLTATLESTDRSAPNELPRALRLDAGEALTRVLSTLPLLSIYLVNAAERALLLRNRSA